MRKQQEGFSPIELLIVVAIILIIAAIAIPNLMRARMAANDSSAAASVHTIVVGEVGYYGGNAGTDGTFPISRKSM
jgi:type IV pilus assembly protein PilA